MWRTSPHLRNLLCLRMGRNGPGPSPLLLLADGHYRGGWLRRQLYPDDGYPAPEALRSDRREVRMRRSTGLLGPICLMLVAACTSGAGVGQSSSSTTAIAGSRSPTPAASSAAPVAGACGGTDVASAF